MMRQLNLGWCEMEDGDVALVFKAETWRAFEDVAKASGRNAKEMMTEAVVGALGTVIIPRRN